MTKFTDGQPKALYGGSFDPPTNGHLDVVERVAGIFPSVEWHIAVNPKKQPFFEVDKRIELMEGITDHLDNVTIGHSSSGFLVDYAQQNGFSTLVRGLRTELDFGEEMTLLKMNKLIMPKEVETIFVPCDPGYEAVSSTAVKQILAANSPNWKAVVSEIVPPLVMDAIVERQAGLEAGS